MKALLTLIILSCRCLFYKRFVEGFPRLRTSLRSVTINTVNFNRHLFASFNLLETSSPISHNYTIFQGLDDINISYTHTHIDQHYKNKDYHFVITYFKECEKNIVQIKLPPEATDVLLLRNCYRFFFSSILNSINANMPLSSKRLELWKFTEIGLESLSRLGVDVGILVKYDVFKIVTALDRSEEFFPWIDTLLQHPINSSSLFDSIFELYSRDSNKMIHIFQLYIKTSNHTEYSQIFDTPINSNINQSIQTKWSKTEHMYYNNPNSNESGASHAFLRTKSLSYVIKAYTDVAVKRVQRYSYSPLQQPAANHPASSHHPTVYSPTSINPILPILELSETYKALSYGLIITSLTSCVKLADWQTALDILSFTKRILQSQQHSGGNRPSRSRVLGGAPPLDVIYGQTVAALAKGGAESQTYQICAEMLEAGIVPTNRTVDTIFQELSRVGSFKAMTGILDLLLRFRVHVSDKAYNAILNAYDRVEAYRDLSYFIHQKYRTKSLDTIALSVIIKCFDRLKSPEQAVEYLLKALREKPQCVTDRIIERVFAILVKSKCYELATALLLDLERGAQGSFHSTRDVLQLIAEYYKDSDLERILEDRDEDEREALRLLRNKESSTSTSTSPTTTIPISSSKAAVLSLPPDDDYRNAYPYPYSESDHQAPHSPRPLKKWLRLTRQSLANSDMKRMLETFGSTPSFSGVETGVSASTEVELDHMYVFGGQVAAFMDRGKGDCDINDVIDRILAKISQRNLSDSNDDKNSSPDSGLYGDSSSLQSGVNFNEDFSHINNNPDIEAVTKGRKQDMVGPEQWQEEVYDPSYIHDHDEDHELIGNYKLTSYFTSILRDLLDLKSTPKGSFQPYYKAAISCLASAGRPWDAVRLLESYRHRGGKETEAMYTNCIFGFRSERNFEAAELVFQQLKNRSDPHDNHFGTNTTQGEGLQLTLASYNALLAVFATCGVLDEKKEAYLREISQRNWTLDTYSYTALLMDQPSSAAVLQLWEEMIDAGVSSTYSGLVQVLNACLAEKKGLIAYQALDRGLKDGVVLDIALFVLALLTLREECMWQESIDLLDRMQQLHIKPSRLCLIITMTCLERASAWKPAVNLLIQLNRRGIHRDVKFINIAISTCNRAREFQTALTLFEKMGSLHLSGSLQPNSETYELVLYAITKLEKLDQALEILKEVQEREMLLSLVTLSQVLTLCESQGRIYDTIKIFESFISCFVILSDAPDESVGTVSVRSEGKPQESSDSIVIDLHGFTLAVARAALRSALYSIYKAFLKTTTISASGSPDDILRSRTQYSPDRLVIITGIGKNSRDPLEPVLKPAISSWLGSSFRPPLTPTAFEGNAGRLVVTSDAIKKWLLSIPDEGSVF